MESDLTKLIRNHVGRILTGGVLASALVACASSNATPQLVDARDALDRAEDSAAARHDPAELERARIALERAEDAHDENPGSAREARLAERAEARANAAMTHAHATQAAREEWRERAAIERAEDRAEARAEVAVDRAETRAELNAELERQTVEDSTVGPAKPMGQRGAVVADTVGEERPEAVVAQQLGERVLGAMSRWTRRE